MSGGQGKACLGGQGEPIWGARGSLSGGQGKPIWGARGSLSGGPGEAYLGGQGRHVWGLWVGICWGPGEACLMVYMLVCQPTSHPDQIQSHQPPTTER
ncbi:hypothetical protein DPEC_G00264730 [Dallia pectoralis]|uniref:Uncharacterized protein n=1 Tax=Dallia pectoralis TaxID=75939 RepID=A0ACC2FS80_DALPE|nr:hypothetical protein DPEC_G00264730 [Dallia pectoralis]